MTEKGTYSDPRCATCKPRIDNTLEDKRVNAMLDAAAIDAARAMGEMLEVGPRQPQISMETMRANRGVTEPDEWAEKEAEIERHFPYWTDEKKAEARASLGPRPYHRGRFAIPNHNPPGWQEVDGVQLPPITWAERMASAEAKYDVAMNKLADAVNARIPAPDVGLYDEQDYRRDLVLLNARAE